jgi:hypothetical protein
MIMKKFIKKSLIVAAACVSAVAVTACDNEKTPIDWTPDINYSELSDYQNYVLVDLEDTLKSVGDVNALDEASQAAVAKAYVEGALGETLTDEVAVRYGYETADAMLQAYAEKLANADEAWNSIKIPDNFKFADDLSLGAAKALETQISKINLGPMGEAAGKQYVEKLNEMLGELDPEDQQAALEALTKIDWSDWDAMDQAKQIMSDLGVEIDFGSEAWQKFAQEMRIAGGAVPDFSGLKQDLIDITSILGKLEFGSTISDADY